jgi:enoyl reductase-like protein
MKPLSWVVLVSILALGTGLFAGLALARRGASAEPATPGGPSPVEPISPRRVGLVVESTEELSRELGLDASQRAFVDSLMQDAAARIAAAEEEIRAEKDRARREILRRLTPEQARQLEDLAAASREESIRTDLERRMKILVPYLELAPEEIAPVRAALEHEKRRRAEYFRELRESGRHVEREAVRAFLKSAAEERDAALAGILESKRIEKLRDFDQVW